MEIKILEERRSRSRLTLSKASIQRCIYADLFGEKESSRKWETVERKYQNSSRPATELKILEDGWYAWALVAL